MELESGAELRAIWDCLAATQRRVLTAIAENDARLFGRAAQARVGGSRGGGLKLALEALIDAGEIVVDPTTISGYRLVDPLLALWLRAGRPQS